MKLNKLIVLVFAGITLFLSACKDDSYGVSSTDPTCGLTDGTYTITGPEGGGHTEKDMKVTLTVNKKGKWQIKGEKPKISAKGSTFSDGGSCKIPFLFGSAIDPLHKCKHAVLILSTDDWENILISFIGTDSSCLKHHSTPAMSDDGQKDPEWIYHNGQSHGTKD